MMKKIAVPNNKEIDEAVIRSASRSFDLFTNAEGMDDLPPRPDSAPGYLCSELKSDSGNLSHSTSTATLVSEPTSIPEPTTPPDTEWKIVKRGAKQNNRSPRPGIVVNKANPFDLGSDSDDESVEEQAKAENSITTLQKITAVRSPEVRKPKEAKPKKQKTGAQTHKARKPKQQSTTQKQEPNKVLLFTQPIIPIPIVPVKQETRVIEPDSANDNDDRGPDCRLIAYNLLRRSAVPVISMAMGYFCAYLSARLTMYAAQSKSYAPKPNM